MGAITRVGGDVDNSTVPRMVGDAEGVAVVNRCLDEHCRGLVGPVPYTSRLQLPL